MYRKRVKEAISSNSAKPNNGRIPLSFDYIIETELADLTEIKSVTSNNDEFMRVDECTTITEQTVDK